MSTYINVLIDISFKESLRDDDLQSLKQRLSEPIWARDDTVTGPSVYLICLSDLILHYLFMFTYLHRQVTLCPPCAYSTPHN